MKFPLIENVTLDDSADDVGQWTWIDFVPQMQVELEEGRVRYHGHLAFKGEYVSALRETMSWNYQMPVDLLLPANRLATEGVIGLHAEELHVDVQNPRQIQIIGSLVIQGIKDPAETTHAAPVQGPPTPVESPAIVEMIQEEIHTPIQDVVLVEIPDVQEKSIETHHAEQHVEKQPIVDPPVSITMETSTEKAAHWSDWLTKGKPTSEGTTKHTLRMYVIREKIGVQEWSEQMGLPVRTVMRMNSLKEEQLKPGQTIWIS